MKKPIKYILFIVALIGLTFVSRSQSTTIKGKVIDAETGESVPFANVYLIKTFDGTTTDFEGHYSFTVSDPSDSIVVSNIGYGLKTKAIKKGIIQTINFQIKAEASALDVVVAQAGENPAFDIIRSVIKNKDKNDKRSLESFNYEAYTKIEIDVNNMTEKFRSKKALRPITKIFDNLELIAGEDGTPVLPVFFSESISEFYFRKNPNRTKEIVKASKVTGIGMDDGSFLTQVIGPTFQEYNFYKNWMKIVDKDFVSPIAASWKNYYYYYLVDSMLIDDRMTYKIDIEPKREQDLAFNGVIWIDKETSALAQIDVRVNKSANLNYVENIKIQQKLAPTNTGAWLPVKNRVVIDIAELNENWAGMVAKFYTSNEKIVVNETRDLKFFEDEIEVVENVIVEDEHFWQDRRHDTLSESEIAVFAMVDSMRNMPIVKTYVDIINFAVNGHQRLGKHFEVGPYITTYSYNNVEEHRFKLGMRSTLDFSRKILVSGYAAYGTWDEEWKYKGAVRYLASKKPWTVMGVSYRKDIEQLGLMGQRFDENGLFLAFSGWGQLKQPFMLTTGEAFFQTDIKKGLSQRIELRNRIYDPRYDFAYKYKNDDGNISEKTTINTSEITVETRYAHGERFLMLDNDRMSLGTKKWPILKGVYTIGLDDVFASQFQYHKTEVEISQKVRFGSFGNTSYKLNVGKVFGTLPYPLLKTHLGNETPFYNGRAFNLMNYLEFVTDQHMTLKFAHHFEGQLLNRIPLMKKLKWRALANADILYGSISQSNLSIIPKIDQDGNTIETFQQIQDYKPYVEIGYGIENILKIIRIEMFHRLTYYSNPGANPWGLKFALQFKL